MRSSTSAFPAFAQPALRESLSFLSLDDVRGSERDQISQGEIDFCRGRGRKGLDGFYDEANGNAPSAS